MQVFYLLPVMTVLLFGRGPAYFIWDGNPDGIRCSWAMMDYGFSPYALLVAKGISQEDHDFLTAQSDVFAFPVDLTEPVSQTVQAFFEGVNLPTDWMTPATTYQELMRQTAGMFVFNQRYGGMSVTYPLLSNIGSLSLIESPPGLSDSGQNFSLRANGDWVIAVQYTYSLDMDLITSNFKQFYAPEGELQIGDFLNVHETEWVISASPVVIQRDSTVSGWIGDALGGVVQVFSDRALTQPGWRCPFVGNLVSLNGYYVASGCARSIFDNATLSTRLRQMTEDEQCWFLATVESFGFAPALISANSQLRLLVKRAGDYWAGQPFYLGGVEF